MFLAILGVILSTPVASAPSRPTTIGVEAPPMEGGGPVVVGIGFHVIGFGRATARDETFDATAHLELRWRDPRLVNRRTDAKLWSPRLSFDNAVEFPRFNGDPVIEVDSDGWVTSRAVLSGKFSSPLDLRKFPFDTQMLDVRISAFDDVSRVRLEPLAESMQMHDDASISDWSPHDHGFRVKERRFRPNGSEFSVLEYQVQVRRRSTYYAWRVLLPLTLLALIPSLVFWFEPTNLQPQISTCMGTWISMLTFGYSVDFTLPKVAYLTPIDRHAVIGFLFASAAAVLVAVIHQAASQGRVPSALRLQKKLRLLYPTAYLLAAFLSASALFRS